MHQKLKKSVTLLLAAAGIGLALTGCDMTSEKTEKAGQVTWSETIEGQKTEMKVSTPPKRAVTMSFAPTEMLLTIGAEKQMAGTSFKEEEIYEPIAEAYKRVPVLAEKWPSYEKFMSVNPDFTIGWEVDFSKRAIPAEKIISAGVPIFIPDSMQDTQATLETNFNDMLELGKIFGLEDNAKKWVDSQKKKLNAIQDKIKNIPHVSVFVFDSEDDAPFTVFEGYTTNVLKLIGADNVMAGQGVDKTWAKTSWESFVQANPDYIIIVDYTASDRTDDDFANKVERLKNNPQLSSVKAIKENHFLRVRLAEITPGVRTVDALERLVNEIHPDMK